MCILEQIVADGARHAASARKERGRKKERTHAMGVYVTRALVTVTSRRRDAMQRLHTVDSAVNYCIERSRS